MPSPSKTADTTAAEAKLFQTILMNLEHKPSVDWDFIAQICGYKDAKSAQERFRQIRIKLNAKEYIGGNKTVSTPSKLASKRAAPKTEMTPSPSPFPKRMKIENSKSPSAARGSTLGSKVINTTWTPANAVEMEGSGRNKTPGSFSTLHGAGGISGKETGGSESSDVKCGMRILTPDGSDDDDAYKEDSEAQSSEDEDHEYGDKESICSEI